MKNILLTVALLIASAFYEVSAITIPTPNGDIVAPDTAEINQQIKELNSNSSISEEEKNTLSLLYNSGLTALKHIDTLTYQQKVLEKTLQNANNTIVSYADEYSKQQKIEAINTDKLTDLTEEKLSSMIEKEQEKLFTLQIELNNASESNSKIQTLPEKAQKTITANNAKIKDLFEKLDSNSNPDLFVNRMYALLMYECNLENSLYKNSLANLPVLQALSNYELKIATLKYNRTEQNVKKLTLKKTIESTGMTDPVINKDLKDKSPFLGKIVDSISKISQYLDEHRKLNALYMHDYQEAESAFTKVEQIQRDLNNQIKELGKTLVLSRLLNKQMSMLPKVKLSYDLDEVIANLNIYIYEIKEQTDTLLSVEEKANEDIRKDPSLEPYKKDLIALYTQRRQALSELYQIMANELNTAIELKLKYASYISIREKIVSDISEQLFWVKSNQAIGYDFFKLFPTTVKYEFSRLLSKFSSEEFKQNTSNTVLLIILPLLVFSLIVITLKKRIRAANDKLALKLDRKNDSIFVTPMAIISNIILMIPNLCWMVSIGAAIICLALADSNKQNSIILVMLLHIFVFVFFLQIIKPNALVQRHFSVQPYRLNQYRNLLNRIWIFSLPLLIFANVAEADSQLIYADISSFSIILLSCLALLYISSKILFDNLKNVTNSSATAVVGSILSICVCLMAVFFVSMGYLYSIVTLTNRLAFTCYIILGYYLTSLTVHRMLYVFINKVYSKKRNALLNNTQESAQSFIHVLNMSASQLCSKVFRIINILLIAVTAFLMYLQWNDLSSVLRYFDTIQLWSKTEVINGVMTVTEYLSLADIMLAAVILIITGILNKNLPVILEKLLLVSRGINQKSTGYTIRVITSYVIISLGIIFAAGAIGIHWENLQWLVAALSVGLGFGLQEIFANFVSGLILLFERQIRVGDIITLNSLSGTVNKIRIRSTTIISFENKEVMIPNREFITSALTNWSLTNTITKLEFIVGISYSSDPDKAKSILRNIISRCRYISKEHSALVYIKELADSAVILSAEIYVTNIGDRKLTLDYLSRETLSQFAQNGIEIPFNQLDVNVKTLEKEEFISKLRTGLFETQQETEK